MVEGGGDVGTDVGAVVLNESVPGGVDFETLGDQAVVALDVLLGELAHAVGLGGDDGHVVNQPDVAVGVATVAKALPTDADAEVVDTGGGNRKAIFAETSEGAVHIDINAKNVDFNFVPSGTVVGRIVDEALVVVFLIPLIEFDVEDGGSRSIDIVNADESIEDTGLGSALVNHGHEHEAVLSRRDSRVGEVAESVGHLGDISTAKPLDEVRIGVGLAFEISLINTGDTTPRGEVVVLSVSVDTGGDNARGVVKIVTAEIHELDYRLIFGKDGALVTVLNLGSFGGSLNFTSLIRRGRLCVS